MDADPDPTLDLTSFFSDFKDAKKNFMLFSYNLPAGTLSSVLKFNFLLKFCLKILLCSIISVRSTPMRKGNYPVPDPYLWLMDPDPGGPKTCGPDPDPQHCFEEWCKCAYSTVSNRQKKVDKLFLLASWKPLKKRAGSTIQCMDPRIRLRIKTSHCVRRSWEVPYS